MAQSRKKTDLDKLIDKFGEAEFWEALVESPYAGDLMLAALLRLFERLREDEDELAPLRARVEELEAANKGLMRGAFLERFSRPS